MFQHVKYPLEIYMYPDPVEPLSNWCGRIAHLEKDPATISVDFFGKVPKDGGVIFNYDVNFGNFKQGFLSMKLVQKIKLGVQGVFF